MPQNIKDEINSLVEKIKNVTSVDRIFLFGSYAYGEPKEESDIDLCIITNRTNVRKRDLIKSIRKSISKVATIPVDILVYEKNEFNERAVLKSTIEHKIVCEGVSIYEQ
jgi:predicted nucleotidyltransferase